MPPKQPFRTKKLGPPKPNSQKKNPELPKKIIPPPPRSQQPPSKKTTALPAATTGVLATVALLQTATQAAKDQQHIEKKQGDFNVLLQFFRANFTFYKKEMRQPVIEASKTTALALEAKENKSIIQSRFNAWKLFSADKREQREWEVIASPTRQRDTQPDFVNIGL